MTLCKKRMQLIHFNYLAEKIKAEDSLMNGLLVKLYRSLTEINFDQSIKITSILKTVIEQFI